jgi:hypothetical protein
VQQQTPDLSSQGRTVRRGVLCSVPSDINVAEIFVILISIRFSYNLEVNLVPGGWKFANLQGKSRVGGLVISPIYMRKCSIFGSPASGFEYDVLFVLVRFGGQIGAPRVEFLTNLQGKSDVGGVEILPTSRKIKISWGAHL